jgi:Toprim domain-containing protein
MSYAAEIAGRLAQNAEAVCRYYLSNGRREGRYWIAGDVANTPGRSLYVRLFGPLSGKGAAGKFTDAATGEHGDLLDLIALSCGYDRLADVLAEARRFLGLPRPEPASPPRPEPSTGLPQGVRRLLATSYPLAGSLAETYLRARGIAVTPDLRALRFYPRCFYRTTDPTTGADRYEAWPALLAAVTDVAGHVTGLHRTWLDPSRGGKAPLPSPRRSLGDIAGHGVWFGAVDDVMAAGEGLETVLSVRTAAPAMPMAAALSSGHLAVFRPPYTLRRLYIAQDNDPAGELAAQKLSRSALCTGIEPVVLTPALKDFNDDLRRFGVDALRAALREQLRPEDVSRFMAIEAGKVEDAVPLQPDPGDGPPAGGPRPRACEEAI